VVSPLYLRDEDLADGVDLLFFAHRDFSRVADGHLARLNLGRAHYRALYFVSRRPNLPVTDLIALLGITKQSLNRVLKTLVAMQFVTMTAGQRDRRQRLLNLTQSGAQLAEQLAALQRARLAQAYRVAGPEGVSGFRKVLSGLLNDRAAALRLARQ
jgi:DNA-binding MarR family transcriptional regulator